MSRPPSAPPFMEAAEAAELSDPAARLARTQGADGSFGGDPLRTALALLALVVLGHTRRRGLRKRTVLKAARWLEAYRGEAIVRLALEALEGAERGRAVDVELLRRYADSSEEGRALAMVLDA